MSSIVVSLIKGLKQNKIRRQPINGLPVTIAGDEIYEKLNEKKEEEIQR